VRSRGVVCSREKRRGEGEVGGGKEGERSAARVWRQQIKEGEGEQVAAVVGKGREDHGSRHPRGRGRRQERRSYCFGAGWAEPKRERIEERDGPPVERRNGPGREVAWI
jgi:hypothetical protein